MRMILRIVVTSLLLFLAGCNSCDSGFGGKAGIIAPKYVVDPKTGLCFSYYWTRVSNYYSYTWVPCTDSVMEQLDPEERHLADTSTR